MPNWKKVVTSGSNAQLASLQIDNAVSASAFSGSFFGDGTGITGLTLELPVGLISGSGQFTSSIDTVNFGTISASIISGSFVGDGSGITNLVFDSATVGNADTASFVQDFSLFNGNRGFSPSSIFVQVLENAGLAPFTNIGTTGSLTDFINELFFPNEPPIVGKFPTSSYTIDEFEVTTASFAYTGPGNTPDPIGQISSSDAVPQQGLITYRTSSNYSGTLFGIDSASGHIFLNRTASRADNTTTDPDTDLGAHQLIYTATDELNETSEFNLFIRIVPNSKPIWSVNSNGSGVISHNGTAPFILDRQESSGSQSDIRRIYFSDANNDVITIRSASDANTGFDHFSISRQDGYIQIDQVTSSLDFETYPSYSFSVTASDEHYEWDGSIRDIGATASINIEIHVQDNTAPTLPQPITITPIVESINDSTTVTTLQDFVIDNDNPISQTSFQGFTLVSAHSGSFTNSDTNNITESLVNNDGTVFSPARNPFELHNSDTGEVRLKTNHFLNEEIAKFYVYQITVTDLYNDTIPNSTAEVVIELTPDSTPVISHIQFPFTNTLNAPQVNEAQIENDFIVTLINSINAEIQLSPACDITINSTNDFIKPTDESNTTSTNFKLNKDLSGSIYTADSNNVISVGVTASKSTFPSSRAFLDFDITIKENLAPTITSTLQNANSNTNQARDGATLATLTIDSPIGLALTSLTAGDNINYNTFELTTPSGFLDPAGLSSSISNNGTTSGEILIQVPEGEEFTVAGTYGYTASIKDVHGFRTTTYTESFQINTGDAITPQTTNYFVNLAAISTEIIANNAAAADNMSQDVDQQGIIFVTFPDNETYTPITYTLGGTDAAFISLSQTNNTASLSVGDSISGSSLRANDTIDFTITSTDVYNNSVTSNLSATVRDVITPTINLALRDGVDMNENEFNGSNAIELTINKSETGSLDIDDTSLDNITLTGQLANKLTAEGVWLDDGTTYTVNYDGNDANIDAGIYDLTASVANLRGFTGSNTIDLEISASPAPIIKSGSNLFVSRGAEASEFILTSQDAATTQSRFNNVSDQAILFVSISRIDGTPLPISYSFTDGRDVAFISASTTDSTASLALRENISGSAVQSQNELHFRVKATDSYSNDSIITPVSISLVDVVAPSMSIITIDENYNTNEARDNTSALGDTDQPEGFARVYFISGTFELDRNDQLFSSVLNTNESSFIAPVGADGQPEHAQLVSVSFANTTPLAPDTYKFEVTASDIRSFTSDHSFQATIEQAGSGSLDDITGLKLIESAVIADPVVTTAAGTASVDNTNVARLTATFNSNEGNPQVVSGSSDLGFFTSSAGHSNLIDVAKDGTISASAQFNASSQHGGSTATAKVHFQDQYGNIGTGSFDVTFVINNPPTITATDQSTNQITDFARDNAELVKLTFDDVESNNINFTTLTFTPDSGNPSLIGIGNNGVTASITASSDPLSAGAYSYTVTVQDDTGTGRITTLNDSFNIQAANVPQVTLGSSFFVSRGARATEFILSTNAAAKTGSRFESVTDQGIIFTNLNNPTDPRPISYSFVDGRDITFISASTAESTASLALRLDVSGSSVQSQDELHFRVKATDKFDNDSLITAVTVSLVDVDPPFTGSTTSTGLRIQTDNYNTNEARGTAFTDTEFFRSMFNRIRYASGTFPIVDDIDAHTFTSDLIDQGHISPILNILQDVTFEDYTYKQVRHDFQLQTSPEPDTYTFSARVRDNRGFNNLVQHDATIVQAESGSLALPGTLRILQTATAGDPVVTTTAGTASATNNNVLSLIGDYTANSDQGDPAAISTGWFTSSTGHDSRINISTDGYLSASTDYVNNLPGQSETLSCKVHFEDQYGNIGTGSFTINVVNNQAPNITVQFQDGVDLTPNLLDTNQALADVVLISASINDAENDTPFAVTLSGSNANLFKIKSFDNTNSASLSIAPINDLSNGDYDLHVSASDAFGIVSSIANASITIVTAGLPVLSLVDSEVAISRGARIGEIFTTSSNAARDAYITTRSAYSDDQSATARIHISNIGSIQGTPTPVSYQVISGEHQSFVSLSFAESTASLFVSDTNHISGSTFTDSEIRFKVRGTDNEGSVGDLAITASVIDPFGYADGLVFFNAVGTAGISTSDVATNLVKSGSRLGNLKVIFESEDSILYEQITYPHDTSSVSISKTDIYDDFSVGIPDAGRRSFAELDITDFHLSASQWVATASLNDDIQYVGVNYWQMSIRDARGFEHTATPSLYAFNVQRSPSPDIQSTNLHVSRGARASEFILTSNEAARTSSRFELVEDQAKLITSHSALNETIFGDVMPVSYSFETGEHVTYISASITDSSASLALRVDVSGSAAQTDAGLNFQVKSVDAFGNSSSYAFTASLVDVDLPRPVTIAGQYGSEQGVLAYTNNWNTNEARGTADDLGSDATLYEGEPRAFELWFVSGTFSADNSDVTSFSSSALVDDGKIRFATRNPQNNLYGSNYNHIYTFQDSTGPDSGSHAFTASIVDDRGFIANEIFKFDISIEQAGSGSLDTISDLKLIESANTADPVVTTAAGTASADNLNVARLTATFNSSEGNPQVVSGSSDLGFFTASTSTPLIDVAKDGTISASATLSPSGQSGSTSVTVDVHFQDQYGNIGTGSFDVAFVVNNPPSMSFTDQDVFNTNEARSGAELVRISFTEHEETVDLSTLSLTSNTTNPSNIGIGSSGAEGLVSASTDALLPGVYGFTASVQDTSGTGRTAPASHSFVITQSPSGSLDQQNSTFFLLESANVADPVVTTVAGTASSDDSNIVRLTATYNNTDEGAPSATATGWFTSSTGHDFRIDISPAGYLSASAALIASNKSGDDGTVSCRVHFTDQYNNIGTGSFDVTFVVNNAPSMSFTDQDVFNTNEARDNAELVKITFTEHEETVQFTTLTLTTNATNPSDIGIGNNNATASITASTSALLPGVYGFTASVQDTSGTTRTTPASHSFTIVDANTLSIGSGNIFVNEGARSGASEEFKSTSDEARNTPLSTDNTAIITASFSTVYGTPLPVTYTIASGRDTQYVSMSFASSTASLFVGETHISGALSASQEIHFAIGAQDAYGNESTSSFTSSVVAVVAPTVTVYTHTAGALQNLGQDTNQWQDKEQIARIIVLGSQSGSYPMNTDVLNIVSANDGNADISSKVSSSIGLEQSAQNVLRDIFADGNPIPELGGQRVSFKSIVENERAFTGSAVTTIDILQAPSGSLDSVPNIYLFEFANTDDPVVTNIDGRSTGTEYRLSATYDTSADADTGDFGNPLVASGSNQKGFFTASSGHSNEINVTKDGYISASINFTQNDALANPSRTCKVHFEDQYGNIGTGSFDINIVPNPPVTIDSTNFDPLQHTVAAGDRIAVINIADTIDTPFSSSFSGRDAGLISSSKNSDGSSITVQARAELDTSLADLRFTASLFDVHADTASIVTRTSLIEAEPALWYAYLTGTGGASSPYTSTSPVRSAIRGLTNQTNTQGTATANAILAKDFEAINNVVINSSSALGDSICRSVAQGNVGDLLLDAKGTHEAYLIASGSTLRGSDIVSEPLIFTEDIATGAQIGINHVTGSRTTSDPLTAGYSSTALVIFFPSGSDEQNAQFTLPCFMEDNAAIPPDEKHYTLKKDELGSANDGNISSIVFYCNMEGANLYNGRSRFGVIATTYEAATNRKYYFYASSGSFTPGGSFRLS